MSHCPTSPDYINEAQFLQVFTALNMNLLFQEEITVYEAHKGVITGISKTRKFIITVSTDGYAHFWNFKVAAMVAAKLFVNKSGIRHVAIYEKAIDDNMLTLLAFGCFGGIIIFYIYFDDDLRTLEELSFPNFNEDHVAPSFLIDPKGDFFVCCNYSGLTEILLIEVTPIDFNLSKYEVLNWLDISNSMPHCLSINKGKAAIAYDNGDVQLFDLKKLKLIRTLQSTEASFRRIVQFSPNGNLLAVSGESGNDSIVLYDPENGKYVGSLVVPETKFFHNSFVRGISFDLNSNSNLLVSCGSDEIVRVWNLDTLTMETSFALPKEDVSRYDMNIPCGVQFTKNGIYVVGLNRSLNWYNVQ